MHYMGRGYRLEDTVPALGELVEARWAAWLAAHMRGQCRARAAGEGARVWHRVV